jgi:O-antigen/teichoic acid export membrane protein
VESARYIPYLSLIYIFRAIRLFYATPYGILKYTRPLSLIYLVVSAIKIFLMWISIREFGLYGVIAASIVAALVEILLLNRGLKEKFRFRYNALKILVAPGLVFAMILTLEPLFGSSAPHVTHLFYLVACALLLGWVYRNEIRLVNPFNILR